MFNFLIIQEAKLNWKKMYDKQKVKVSKNNSQMHHFVSVVHADLIISVMED